MKKTLIFVLLAALCFSAKAWEWNSSTYTRTFTRTCSEGSMLNSKDIYKGKIYECTKLQIQSMGIFTPPGDVYPNLRVVKNIKPYNDREHTASGVLFSKKSVPFIMMGGESPWVIKKAEITYCTLNNDNRQRIHARDCNVKINNLGYKEGVLYYTAVLTPKVPVRVLALKSEGFDNVNTNNEVSGLEGATSGCIITSITLECFDTTDEMADVLTNQVSKLEKDRDAALKQAEQVEADADLAAKLARGRAVINGVEHRVLAERYSSLNGADVNADGEVNAADVVSVYNTIINGSETTSYLGHEYVDLGLPSGVKWAACNVGAAVPEAFGDYFAYREYYLSFLGGKNLYVEDNYVPDRKFEKPLDWAGNWAVPTCEQMDELKRYCTYTIVKLNEVECVEFTSTINGKKLILPLAGCIVGTYGYCNLEVADSSYLTELFDVNSFENGVYKKCYVLSFSNTNPLTAEVDKSNSWNGYSLRMVFK